MEQTNDFLIGRPGVFMASDFLFRKISAQHLTKKNECSIEIQAPVSLAF